MDNITTLDQLKSLAEVFSHIKDPRKPKGIRYQLSALLILLSLAKLCFQDTPSEIADWVANRSQFLMDKLGLKWKRMPSLSTWQRLIGQHIDAGELDKQVGQYFLSLTTEDAQLLNIDGKVLCSSRDKASDHQLHLLAIQESKSNTVIAQTPVEVGENEISAAKRLIEEVDLKDKILSGDAIFAQREISEKVVDKGGEYLWKLRANQGNLYEMAVEHFNQGADKYIDRASIIEKGHGRIEQREVATSFRLANKMEFPFIEQVIEIKRKSEEVKTGEVSEETIYAITSLRVEEYGAKECLEVTRGHWSIENGLHRRRDVTFKEDAIRQTSKRGGRVMAIMNNLAIGIMRKKGWDNIAKARRYYNAAIEEALGLIMNPLPSLL
jgi:predicted transposase YbfD/YdcC